MSIRQARVVKIIQVVRLIAVSASTVGALKVHLKIPVSLPASVLAQSDSFISSV